MNALLWFLGALAAITALDFYWWSHGKLCPTCCRRHAIFPARGNLNRWSRSCFRCWRARAARGYRRADASNHAPRDVAFVPIEVWRDGRWQAPSAEPLKLGETRSYRFPS